MNPVTASAPLKIVFAGTPHFAAEHLACLMQSRHQVVAVYTQPDRPAGRGRKLTPSPVKQLALEHHINVHQPTDLSDQAAVGCLQDYHADIMLVVAYGILLPKAILAVPRLGCINVHASLLPRWRGAAPIQRALLAGDTTTGISIMQMQQGLDTGPIWCTASLSIEPQDTSASLYAKLTSLGQTSLIKTLDNLHRLTPQPQNDNLSIYAHKLSKSEGAINWQQPSALISRHIRGLNPWPAAFTWFANHRLRLLDAQPTDNHTIDNHTHSSHLSNPNVPGEIVGYTPLGVLVACEDSHLLVTQIQWPGSKMLTGAQIGSLKNTLPVGACLLSDSGLGNKVSHGHSSPPTP